SENRPARSQQVYCRDGMSSDRFDPIAWNRNTGTQLYPFSMLGCERQAHVNVAVDHLRIVKPGVAEAVVFGNYHVLPRIRAGRVGDCEFHRGFSPDAVIRVWIPCCQAPEDVTDHARS